MHSLPVGCARCVVSAACWGGGGVDVVLLGIAWNRGKAMPAAFPHC